MDSTNKSVQEFTDFILIRKVEENQKKGQPAKPAPVKASPARSTSGRGNAMDGEKAM